MIDALNRDMPFDRFTIEQIAGDMLPNATPEQKIATGFHRNAMTNEEGGADPEESLYEVLVDRANTTATVWLGTTLGCAQCHNHKYDPFSQKDYYRFLSFFANPDYESRTFGDGTRFFERRLDLATPEQEECAQGAAGRDRSARSGAEDRNAGAAAGAGRTGSLRSASAERAWTPLVPETVAATNGVTLTPQPDGSVLASGPNPALTTYTVTAVTPLRGITGVRLEALLDQSLPKSGPGRDPYGHFRITGLQAEIAPADPLGRRRRGRTGTVRPVAGPQPLRFKTMKVDDFAAAFKPEDLLVEGAAHTRKSGAWTITAIRDTTRAARHAVLVPDTPFGFAAGTRLTVRIEHLDGTIGQGLGRFRLALTTAADPLDRRRPAGAAAAGRSSIAAADRRTGGRRGSDRVLPLDHARCSRQPARRWRPRASSSSISRSPPP